MMAARGTEKSREHRTYQLVVAEWRGVKQEGDEALVCYSVTQTLEFRRAADSSEDESEVAVGEETCLPLSGRSTVMRWTLRGIAVGTSVKIGWYRDVVVREWENEDGTRGTARALEWPVTQLRELDPKMTEVGRKFLSSQLAIATFEGVNLRKAVRGMVPVATFKITESLEFREKRHYEQGPRDPDDTAQVEVGKVHGVFLLLQPAGVQKLIRGLRYGASVKLGWSTYYVHRESIYGEGHKRHSLTSEWPVTVLEDLTKSKDEGTKPEKNDEELEPVLPDMIVEKKMLWSQMCRAEYTGTGERELNGEAALWACFRVTRVLAYMQAEDEEELDDQQVRKGEEYCVRPDRQDPDIQRILATLSLDEPAVKLGWQHDRVTRRTGGVLSEEVVGYVTMLVVAAA